LPIELHTEICFRRKRYHRCSSASVGFVRKERALVLSRRLYGNIGKSPQSPLFQRGVKPIRAAFLTVLHPLDYAKGHHFKPPQWAKDGCETARKISRFLLSGFRSRKYDRAFQLETRNQKLPRRRPAPRSGRPLRWAPGR
jgi:hypothetical protein